MAGRDRSRQCSVFVGNIPYDADEDQLRDIFSRVGPVVEFRLVYDKDNQVQKGFGFCEYRDAETALSAIRNLDKVECNGRPLNVDSADKDFAKKQVQGGALSIEDIVRRPSSTGDQPMTASRETILERVAQLQQGSSQAQGTNVDEAVVLREICEIVGSMSPEQLFHLLAQAQQFVEKAPTIARPLFSENPSLTHALLHAQFLVGMIQEPVVPMSEDQLAECRRRVEQLRGKKLVQYGAAPPPGVLMQQDPGMIPPMPFQNMLAGSPMPVFPATAPPPPVAGMMPPHAMGGADQVSPEQLQALVEKVSALTPEMFQQLPRETQQQVHGYMQMRNGGLTR
mmetsp:Transcript_29973/g.71962  ORF Transcript_29973/g.71962 Transcript_29973/m.71962 type:complete len:339 (-) Transcript_29973:27-1043(-)